MTGDIINMEKVILNLKEKYFHLFTQHGFLSFSELLDEVSTSIQTVLKVEKVDIFLFNAFTNRFENRQKQASVYNLVDSMSMEEFQSLLTEENGQAGFSLANQILRKSDDDVDALIFQMKSKTDYFGFILVKITKFKTKKYIPIFREIVSETQQFLVNMKSIYKEADRAKKNQILLDLSSSFRITMNVESILEGVFQCLKESYPDLRYYFILEEASNSGKLPIKPIDYYKECEASTQAYLNGEIQFSNLDDNRLLYVPLQGKQGVYGVLEVIISTFNQGIYSEDIEFITNIAQSAGRGLENVKLYTQSTRLIEDLKLVDQSSQQLNTNMSLSDTHAYMSNLIQSSFHAQEVGFIYYQNENNTFRIQEESTSFFSTDKGKWFIEHLNHRSEKLDEGLFIGDFGSKTNSIDFPYQSVMMVPMLHEKEIIGSVIVLHQQEYFFSLETFKLLKSLVQHSTLTIVNALLKEELEQLVRTDYLTKLYSRKFLDETMNSHLMNGSKGSFILIDIDNFKRINDQYGHNVGDQIILQVANIIKDNIRSHDIAARWGGEELAIYLPNTPIHLCLQVAERLVEKVSEQTQPKVTISCGISHWDDTLPEQTSDIFLRADRALYIAKEKGKNQVVRHDEVFN